jgi:transposase-like protein
VSVFKRRRFPSKVILVCVRWYCKYDISYRDLIETMQERGVAVDHTTIFRWVQRYAPETDKLCSCSKAIRRLQREDKLSKTVRHRTSKYLNNIIEADYGALKQAIRPARGFQTMQTAYATIKGFEIMRMIRRGHCVRQESDAAGEVRFINKLFGLPG